METTPASNDFTLNAAFMKAVLDNIYDRMVPGGIIAFDEYSIPEWPGETKAVDEFIKKYKLKLHSLPWTFSPSAYTIIE